MVVVPLPCDQEREAEREGGERERRTSSHAMFKHSFHRAIPHGWPRDTRHQMEQHLTGALAENGISLWGGSIPELELKLELLGGDLIQRVRGGRVGERVK